MTSSTVPRLSPLDTAGVVADVVLPLAARGAIVRRPPVEGLLDRTEGDRRAVLRLLRVRDRYARGRCGSRCRGASSRSCSRPRTRGGCSTSRRSRSRSRRSRSARR